jgi:hypothetical protein
MPVGRSAVISACGRYRYRLERDLARPGRVAACIMLNPSRADAESDDPTLRKCLGFASRLGIGRLIVVNKCAFRATDPKLLRAARDAVGPDNDRHIEQALRDADLHILAWGSLARLPAGLRDRWREVLAIASRVGCPLYCFGVASDGQPLHPLYLPYGRKLVAFSRE